jgi:1-acyl-sn-glycerol-3-phosphate acyltransferase
MRGLLKALWACGIILWHLFAASLGKLWIRDPARLRAYYLRQVHLHARWLVRALALEINVEGRENLRPGQNYLFVGNHLSYLDAIVIPAQLPTAFVTSIEMREVPLLGLLTELGGCLYVERRSKENIHREISGITEALQEGFNVVVFPEATSTDGSQVRPFKRPLFAAAPQSLRPVLPLVIEYERLDGEPVTRANRDALCWYGDMGFGGHFFRLALRKRVEIRLTFLPEIPVTAGTGRDKLMEEAFARISSRYRPIA